MTQMEGDWSVAHRKNGDFEIVDDKSTPNLMRPIEELEKELSERARNLYPMNAEITRGQAYLEEVYRILAKKKLPSEYALSLVWQHAHQLFWQIEAMKGNPEATLSHPV